MIYKKIKNIFKRFFAKSIKTYKINLSIVTLIKNFIIYYLYIIFKKICLYTIIY